MASNVLVADDERLQTEGSKLAPQSLCVRSLCKTLQDLDNAPATREQAALALGKIRDKSCVDQLTRIAEEYPDVMARRAILKSVKRISE